MRLTVLATAFFASIASALPVGNTTLSTSLEPVGGGASTAAKCRSSTLTWAIDPTIPQTDGKAQVMNIFWLRVSPSNTAVAVGTYITPEKGRDYYMCGKNNIACIKFDGWREDKPKLAFKFNGRWYRHADKNAKTPPYISTSPRENFEYWDCVISD